MSTPGIYWILDGVPPEEGLRSLLAAVTCDTPEGIPTILLAIIFDYDMNLLA